MTITVGDVASWVQGEIVGDPSQVIRAARPLSDHPKADEITVVINEKYLSSFHASEAGAGVVDYNIPLNGKTLVRVKDPLMAFVAIVQKLHVKPSLQPFGIHPTASIHPSATIGDDVSIGAFVVIGEGSKIGNRAKLQNGVSIGNHCELGDDVNLGPHVVLYDGTILGNWVTIHANSVIGSDGFGYRTIGGIHVKVPQVGHVEIADQVEIGACTTIDRATFGATRIGRGTKIDNLVMIGHNCQLGQHNMIVGQVGIAGSVHTGDYVVMAGQVGIADHCHIGDRTMLGAKAGVHKDIPADQKMLGAPATPASEQMRIMSSLEKLPEIRKEIREIKKHLGMADS